MKRSKSTHRPSPPFRGSTAGSFLLCPECGHEKSAVVDTRKRDNMLTRRRCCVACGLRFTTYEIPINKGRFLSSVLDDLCQTAARLDEAVECVSRLQERFALVEPIPGAEAPATTTEAAE